MLFYINKDIGYYGTQNKDITCANHIINRTYYRNISNSKTNLQLEKQTICA